MTKRRRKSVHSNGASNGAALHHAVHAVPEVHNQMVTTHGPYKIDDERFTGQIVQPSANSYPLTQQNALSHSGIWRATTFICDKVANTPLYVRRRLPDGGSEIDRGHDGHLLVRRKASNTMLAVEWKRATMFHCFYTAGNAFSYIKPANGKRFGELILLDPRSMVMYVVLDDFLAGTEQIQSGTIIYEYHQQGRKFILSQADVFHIRGLSYNGLWGLPFFDYVKFTAGAGNVARDFAFRFFEKGANPSFVVYYPRGLAPEKESAWMTSVKSAMEGIGNSQVVFPLYNDAKIQDLTRDPDKTQALEGRAFSLREIANFSGLPPSTLGVEDAQSYNSLEIATDAALDAIDPWFVRVEEECNDKLLTAQQKRSESHFYEFAREEVKRLDYKTKVDTAITELNNGGLNQDEYRNIFKRPAGLSENGQRFRMPANIIYMDGSPVSSLPVSNVRDAVFDSARRGFGRVTNKLVRLAGDPSKLLEFIGNGAPSDQPWEEVRPHMSAALGLVPDGDEELIRDWLGGLLADVKLLIEANTINSSSLKQLNDKHLAQLEAKVCQYVLSQGT